MRHAWPRISKVRSESTSRRVLYTTRLDFRTKWAVLILAGGRVRTYAHQRWSGVPSPTVWLVSKAMPCEREGEGLEGRRLVDAPSWCRIRFSALLAYSCRHSSPLARRSPRAFKCLGFAFKHPSVMGSPTICAATLYTDIIMFTCQGT